jgi:hypothetical protein
MLRRSMLSTSAMMAAGAAALAACSSTPSPPGTLPAQILADVTGALNQLASVIPSLTKTTPPVLTQSVETTLLADVNYAQGFMATVSSSTPAASGVTVLARAEGYFNAVLVALLPLPIPAPFSLIIVAANVIAPELEALIASFIPAPVTPAPVPAPAPAAARARMVAHGMTIEEARKVLKVHGSL